VNDPNERRALIAIVLCLAVFFVWSTFFAPKKPKPTEPPPGEVATAPVDGVTPPTVAPSPATPALAEAPCDDQRFPVESASVRLQVSTCGGAVRAVTFPNYDAATQVTPWWTWVWSRVKGTGSGGWDPYVASEGKLEHLTAKGAIGLTGRGDLDDGGTFQKIADNPLTLQRVTADGLTVTKTWAPTASPDVFDLTVRYSASVPLNGPFWVSAGDTFRKPATSYEMVTHPSAVVDGDLEQLTDPTALKEPKDFKGPVSWFGIENRYFVVGLAPEDPAWGVAGWAPAGERQAVRLVGPATSIAPNSPVELHFTVYAGRKDVERMSAVGHDFDKAAALGFWGFFSKILLFFLHMFHSGIGNWGASILALTFLVRLSLYPIAARAFKSGKAMQEIQPLLKEVQEKYKDDKEAQTRETMALWQKHNVNPLGGCLPLFIQMPVFFALYSALMHTPDLFGASFLYLHDLSAPDPYGVLPFIMAIGMVVQQRLTPMTGMDPAQAQMMRAMPLVFALFMFGVPSGLSLYYALNTILSIAQQQYNTRSYQPKPAPA
jgi:YidC/Oxa1 family membrane protein insertase